jgi:hypothetical protein
MTRPDAASVAVAEQPLPPLTDEQVAALHTMLRPRAQQEDCWVCEAVNTPLVREWAMNARTLEFIQERLSRRYEVPRQPAPYAQIAFILQDLEECIFTLRPDLRGSDFFELRAAILGPDWSAAEVGEDTDEQIRQALVEEQLLSDEPHHGADGHE